MENMLHRFFFLFAECKDARINVSSDHLHVQLWGYIFFSKRQIKPHDHLFKEKVELTSKLPGFQEPVLKFIKRHFHWLRHKNFLDQSEPKDARPCYSPLNLLRVW